MNDHGHIIVIAASSFAAGCLLVGFMLKPELERANYETQRYKAKALEMEVRKDMLERVLTNNAAKEGKQP